LVQKNYKSFAVTSFGCGISNNFYTTETKKAQKRFLGVVIELLLRAV
jgi:hypothetical protein